MVAIQMNSRIYIVGAVLLASLLLFCGFIVYGKEVWNSAVEWMNTDTQGVNDFYSREIGTNIDLWLNGYLGIFFRFKIFGMLNWLLIPLFVYFLATFRNRERWQLSLGFVLLLTTIFICIQGYQNYRYQLTLYPVFISLIFIFGWETIRTKNWKMICLVISGSSVLVFLNLYYSMDNYKYYMLNAMGRGEAGERFPFKLVEYIKDNVNADAVIWQRKQPLLFYHTDKIGTKYYNKNTKYLLTREKENIPIKHADYKLVIEDQGYKLYKIIDKSVLPTTDGLKHKAPNFETNFTDWTGNSEIDANEIFHTLFPMQILGIRGEFLVEKISKEAGNIIRIMLKNANFNERPEIQFGYFIQSDKLNLPLADGHQIVVKAKVRLIESPSGNLFIQDKTDYWSRESVKFKNHSWQDIFVRKTPRVSAEKICFGISWLPKSKNEALEIGSISVFIEKIAFF
jgi:hypothetical protein